MSAPSGPMFPHTHSSPLSAIAPLTSMAMSGAEASMFHIEMEAYSVRDEVRKQRQADTQTQETYGRYVSAYERWWNSDQFERVQREPNHSVVPAFPILAGKVVLFLNHEIARCKYKRGSSGAMVPGTNVGKEVIKSTISALESHRKHNQHMHTDVAGSQTKLRDDIRIKEIEQAMMHNEPNRMKNSQTLKASGSSADTYTPRELSTISLYCLQNPRTKSSLLLHTRDRAMVLLAASSAYRGNSLRPLEWSDIGLREIPNTGAGFDSKIIALVMLSYNSKHNQDGRLDEHGVIRHRLPELCPVGALAIHMFAQFHILDIPRPAFAPDFSPASQEAGYGTYGRREWYEYKVFYASEITKTMSYDNHLSRIKSLHKANDIDISKATHATHVYAAEISRSHGSSADDTKALGGCNDKGSFKPCYDNKLPLPALLGAAMFNGAKPESHFLARECLSPPVDIMSALFPWVEQELAAYKNRLDTRAEAKDFALDQFLRLLLYFRQVLVQDLAVLFHQAPSAKLFLYAPFDSPAFRTFAESVPDQISAAEEASRVALHNLPEHMAASMRGALTTATLNQQQQALVLQSDITHLREEMTRLIGTVGILAESERPRKRSRKNAVLECIHPGQPPNSRLIIPPEPPLPIQSTSVFSSPPSAALPNFTISITNSPGATVSTTGTSSLQDGHTDPPANKDDDIVTEAVVSPPLPLVDITPGPVIASMAAPLSHLPIATPATDSPRTSKWDAIVRQFNAEQIMKHKWVYKDNSWIPCYDFQTL